MNRLTYKDRLLAVLVSIIYVLPALQLASRSKFDPQILDDFDEPLYFGLLRDSVIRISAWRSQLTGFREAFFPSRIPHELVDVIGGQLVSLSGVTLTQLAIGLDIFCIFCSLLIFQRVYGLFFRSAGSARAAAYVTVLLPWLGAFSAHLRLPPLFGGHIQTLPHLFFPSIPVCRAIYTQLSFTLFGYLILIFNTEIRNGWKSPKRQAVLGIGSGLLLYVYFFAWATLLTLLVVATLLLRYFNAGDAVLPRWKVGIAIVLGCAALASLPGVLLLFSEAALISPGPAGQMAPTFPFARYLFFSPIDFLLLIISLLIVSWIRDRRIRGETDASFALCWVAAIFIAEFLLMNTQPILHRWLVPYHFPLFYLHPLFSGLFVGLITDRMRQPQVRSAVMSFFVVLSVTPALAKAFGASTQPVYWQEATSLLSELAKPNYAKRQIYLLPVEDPQRLIDRHFLPLMMPYWVKFFTQLNPFPQLIGFSPDREKLVRQELFLGLLFFGSPRLTAPCPPSLNIPVENDIFSGANTFIAYQRGVDCQLARQLIPRLSPCQVSQEYEIDLALVDQLQQVEAPKWWNSFGSIVWRSPQSRFAVWQIDSTMMRRYFCRP